MLAQFVTSDSTQFDTPVMLLYAMKATKVHCYSRSLTLASYVRVTLSLSQLSEVAKPNARASVTERPGIF